MCDSCTKGYHFHVDGPCRREDCDCPKVDIYDYQPTEQYLLLRSEIKQIVEAVIKEAKDSWNWGEGMDMEVLWLRVDRDILQANRCEENV